MSDIVDDLTEELKIKLYEMICKEPNETIKLIAGICQKICEDTNATTLRLTGFDKDIPEKLNFGLFYLKSDENIRKVNRYIDRLK